MRGLVAVIAVGCGVLAGMTVAPLARAAPPAGGLDVGRYHACALVAQAGVRCWGYGADGA